MEQSPNHCEKKISLYLLKKSLKESLEIPLEKFLTEYLEKFLEEFLGNPQRNILIKNLKFIKEGKYEFMQQSLKEFPIDLPEEFPEGFRKKFLGKPVSQIQDESFEKFCYRFLQKFQWKFLKGIP